MPAVRREAADPSEAGETTSVVLLISRAIDLGSIIDVCEQRDELLVALLKAAAALRKGQPGLATDARARRMLLGFMADPDAFANTNAPARMHR